MRKFVNFLMAAWPVVIAASLLVNIYVIDHNNDEIVKNKSRGFFSLIQSVLVWNLSNGHIVAESARDYVGAASERRAIASDDSLTMVNPAYITRLLAGLQSNGEVSAFNLHVTSLNPTRPSNGPDEWETKALETFSKAGDEYFEKVEYEGVHYYRYMAPLVTQQVCLSCHADQGYKVGDIRGGISISTPVTSGMVIIGRSTRQQIIIIYALIFILGFFGVLYFRHSLFRYQRILIDNNKKLQESNDTKDKLFNIISHDLRMPSANIAFLAETLKNKRKQMSEEKLEENIDLILKASRGSQSLLNNLLDWSRLQANRIQVRPARLNTYDVIETVIEQTNMQANSKNIKVVNMSEPQFVYADPDMFTTILRNLVSNGLKFSFEGQRIAIDAVPADGGMIRMSVADTGVGMTEEKMSKLFKINVGTTTTKGTNQELGTGLGLLLCKEFVERNGGKIWVESAIDKGSIFYFTLPAVSDAVGL